MKYNIGLNAYGFIMDLCSICKSIGISGNIRNEGIIIQHKGGSQSGSPSSIMASFFAGFCANVCRYVTCSCPKISFGGTSCWTSGELHIQCRDGVSSEPWKRIMKKNHDAWCARYQPLVIPQPFLLDIWIRNIPLVWKVFIGIHYTGRRIESC